jgi:hypothetical protein
VYNFAGDIPMSRTFTILVFLVTLHTVFTAPGLSQATASQPPLFFRVGWNGRKIEGVAPLNQDSVENPKLVMQLYGPGTYSPGRDSETTLNVNVRKLGDEGSSIVWSGMAEGNWAVTLKHKDSYVDLSRPLTKIRWRTFQDGSVQVLRPVLKLADGTYVLGIQGSGTTADYETTELVFANMRWVDFDPVRVLDRGNPKSSFGATNPDLSRVDEIGFTTLSRGGGHGVGVSSHVDWIEVYGFPVPRS